MKVLAIQLASASLGLLMACHGEPEFTCERVRFGWPAFDLNPSADVNPQAEGLQVDFDVRSDIEAGVRATLTIAAGDSDPVFAGEAQTQEDGSVSFRDITVPEGEIVFFLDADSQCGRHRSGTRTFVWDGLGFPSCSLSLASEPDPDPESPYPVLRSGNDEDLTLDGMQVQVRIAAGRPDMRVRLFALDRETGATQTFELEPDQGGLAETTVTLGEGEQALRAVCFWDAQGLRPSSATWTYLVEL